MYKRRFAKLAIVCSSVVMLVLPSISIAAFADTSGFDQSIDGLVTNFENYQSFGGKTGAAVKSVSYNVFLPTGMGFTPSNDTLEMKVSMPQGGSQFVAYASNLSNAAGSCKAISNGYNCTAVWDFTASWPQLTAGTYSISFVVLNQNTQPVNGVYMNLSNNTSQPLYSETGQVFINEPLTTPYASFTSDVQSLDTLVDPSAPTSLGFVAEVNASNSPTETDFFLDGKRVQQVTSYSQISDSSFTGGLVDQFQYTLSNLTSLSNGNHILTAITFGSGYSVPVLTQDGQSQVNIEVAYGADQACVDKISSINEITKKVNLQVTTELNQIQMIDDEAVTYFSAHSPTISNYSQLVNTTNNDNKKVVSDMAALAKDNNFQCSNTPNQITSFITDLNKVQTDLTTYQNDSVNMINQAGGLNG